MPRALMLFVIGLFFGGGAGFVTAASWEVTLTGHDHGDPAHHGAPAGHAPQNGGHHHGRPLEVTGTAPAVSLALHPDANGAMNLQIMTTDFAFAPQAVNGPHVPGQGHAHVYVNGAKIARAYGPWMHMDNLPATGEIRVTLNANSHETLSVNGQPIAATIPIPAR